MLNSNDLKSYILEILLLGTYLNFMVLSINMLNHNNNNK